VVRLFGRRKARRRGTLRAASPTDTAHLAQFVKSRPGVEAYLEPRTTVTETTLVLVAASGEWTRRRVAGAEGAREFARKHGVPLYDASVVGYPQRMRDWNAKRKAGELGQPPGTSP
jgi:hypothetical protein